MMASAKPAVVKSTPIFNLRPALTRLLAACGLAAFTTGCLLAPPKQQASAVQNGAVAEAPSAPVDSPIAPPDPSSTDPAWPSARDPVATPRKLYEMSIYMIAVPAGTISGNEEFWKRIDENVLDPITMQTLQWNGIRVGMAPASEFEHLQKYIDDPDARRASVLANRAENLEVPLSSGLDARDLWWLDRNGELRGRTFEDFDTLFYFTFRQPLRKPDKVDVAIAPAIRARRARLELIPRTGEQREFRYEKPESIYDLGLSCEIPLGQLLIVAPSPQWRGAANAGKLFFTRDDPAQQMERIIVVMPEVRGTIRPAPVPVPEQAAR